MGLLGLVAVVIILLGGFKWMTSGGEETKVGEAKKLIISGVIGLIIILSAYAIANFVVGSILNGTK
jgi:Zn-dependent protease with chaperone function